MRAFLPGQTLEKPVEHTVQKRTEPQGKPSPDHLYAINRRLGVRLSEVERKLSEIRRDLNRIEKRQYRAGDNMPSPSEKPAAESFVGLFGIGG